MSVISALFGAGDPPLSFRFGVFFFMGGIIPNPLDIKFQKVSGLSSEIETQTIDEGGRNINRYHLPNKVTSGNLVLERGMVIGSLLNLEFEYVMSNFRFYTSNVLITLFNASSIPVSAWLFWKAYPVKWAVSDLDADANSLVIDTMELAYTRYQSIRI